MNQYENLVVEIASKAIITENKVPIELDTNLFNIGINSMTLISILMEIENTTNINISEFIQDFDPPETVRDIVNMVNLVYSKTTN